MSGQPTPGPWRLVPWMESHNHGRILGPHGETLARVEGIRDQGPANQALMAAAPDLLAALQRLTSEVLWITDQIDSGRLYAIERLHRDGIAIDIAHAAIEKAFGKEAP